MLQHQAQTKGSEQGFQRATIKEANHPAFDGDAHQRGNQKGGGYGNQQAPLDQIREEHLHAPGGVGANHDEFAVRHVDHAHHAEGDGQADSGE